MTCKTFSMGGLVRMHWDPWTRAATVLAETLDDTGTWERLLTAEDPEALVGRVAWRRGLPGPSPITVGGISYPHLHAAEAAGAGIRCGPDLYVPEGVSVQGAGWAPVWAWDPEVWIVAPADPLPG